MLSVQCVEGAESETLPFITVKISVPLLSTLRFVSTTGHTDTDHT